MEGWSPATWAKKKSSSFAAANDVLPWARTARIMAVRCPWHHAAFDLATGEAVRAPALSPVSCWRVERRGDAIVVREKAPAKPAAISRRASSHPPSVLIIGGGAAGLAAADMLRREAYEGPITIISADSDAPVDRPNLSKDFLAGQAQDEWIPLWPADLYAERRVELA